MKILALTIIITLMSVFEANAEPSADGFFTNLHSLCGEKFVGSMTFPVDGQDSFKGKTLVAEFTNCDDDVVRVPFNVGEDASRTWIFSKTSQGLRLKHEHLLKDGSIDPISDYGGDSVNSKERLRDSSLSRSFPADSFTQQLIPEAATNVWTVSLSADLQILTYHLERHNKARFTAVLERQSNTK